MPERNIPDIIKQLKKVKEERGLKIPDILQMTHDYADEHKTGIYPSEASLRRLFAKDSDNQNFDYDRTVQPVARVLLWMYEDNEFNPNHAQIYFEQRNGLQSVVNLHNAAEERLRGLLESQKEQYEKQLEKEAISKESEVKNIKDVYEERCRCQQKTIDNLENTNAFLQDMIRKLLEAEDADRKSKWHLHNEIHELHMELNKLKQYHVHEEEKNNHI